MEREWQVKEYTNGKRIAAHPRSDRLSEAELDSVYQGWSQIDSGDVEGRKTRHFRYQPSDTEVFDHYWIEKPSKEP